jgi:serine/threonine protein kinase/Tol biopolymer transport system component
MNSGTRIGPYEVVGALGAGGMGEVWRATDTRLGRQVALKLLPEDFAADPERHARFEREAKVLASLNHPNIAVLYGLEHLTAGDGRSALGDGSRSPSDPSARPSTGSEPGARSPEPHVERASRAVHVLVMELVEGDDLAQRLARGPIPTDEAFAIALQVAAALEAAHDKGIVHRDLKPANVKVTPAGTVKVLDFGLAKAWEAEGANTNPSLSPTITAHHTREGVILGTAAYMSPEQARGKPVDRRADIWAFGCLVYEMLTGTQTFAGDTVTDVIAAVVTRDPDWSALPPGVRPRSREVLRRCMEKDPKRRYRDIGDVRFELEESLSAPAPTPAPVATVAAPVAARRSLLPWIVAGLGLALAAGLGAAYLKAASVHPKAARAYILPPEKTSFDFDASVGGPVLSPDGTRLAFAATDASSRKLLWVRPIDSLTAQPLEGTDDASFPFWSPDGRFVGFFVAGKLRKIDTLGGPPQTICASSSGRGGTWSSAGVIVFAPDTYGGLQRVPSAGGAPATLTEIDTARKQTSQRWPFFLPDGRHFVYWAGNPTATTQDTNGIYLGSLDDKEQRFLFPTDSNAVYCPPGYVLFLRDRSLMAQPFDAGAAKATGEAFPIAEEVANPQSYRLGCFSAARDGTLVYQTGENGRVQAIWTNASGGELETVGELGLIYTIRLSPDGGRLAEAVQDPQTKNVDIWLLDLARSVKTRFTFDPAVEYYPVWSPDGSRIAFSSNQKGHFDIYVKNAGGAGEPELFFASDEDKFVSDWTSDGRFLTFTELNPKGKTQADLWTLPLAGDRKPSVFLQTQFNEANATFSPDGRWAAYQSDESGKNEVYVTTFPTPSGKWQVSQSGGVEPRWRHDGAGLFFRALDGKLMEAAVTAKGAVVEVATPHEASKFRLGEFGFRFWVYGAAPKDDRFVVLRPEKIESMPLTLVTQWMGGIKP